MVKYLDSNNRSRSPLWGSRWERGGSRIAPVAPPDWVAAAAAPGGAGRVGRGGRGYGGRCGDGCGLSGRGHLPWGGWRC